MMKLQQCDLSIRVICDKANKRNVMKDPKEKMGFYWETMNTHSNNPLLVAFEEMILSCRSLDEVYTVMKTFVPYSVLTPNVTFPNTFDAFQASTICAEQGENGQSESFEIKRNFYAGGVWMRSKP